jgi:mono/diheme cytochrome c family protein
MAAGQGGACFDTIAEKWHALARRRLAYICELEHSGRWKRYCTQEQLAFQLHEAERVTARWAALADRASALAPRADAAPHITRLITALLISVLPATHQASAQSLKRGEDLLTRSCASCHSIGRNGESPNKSAPAFRNLGQRYPIESLEEALGEGIMTGHPDMPEFTFDAKDVGAIIAYLKSIQQR